jgi:predicted metal-dependent peptidase
VDVTIVGQEIPLPNGGTTTACCSDTEITIYRGFVESSFDKALATYAHEVMHIALMHTVRYNDFVKQGLTNEWRIGYNILGDLRINEILKHEGMRFEKGVVDKDNIEEIIKQNGFTLHKGVGQLEDIIKCVNADDMLSTDRAFGMFRNYYKHDGKTGKPKGPGGNPGNKSGDGSSNRWTPDLKPGNKSAKEAQEDIERKIVSGLVGSKNIGNDLSGLRRMLEKQFYNKSIDYSKMIKQSLIRELQKVIDYNQPHKKSIELDFMPYLPRWNDIPSKYHVAIGIDSSGSMGDATINKICGELFRLITRYPVSFDVFVCDCAIRDRIMNIDKVEKLKKVSEIGGAGGTSFKPVFKEIEKAKKAKGRKRRNYKTLIYFTDGYGDQDSLKEPKGLKTYWVVDDQGSKIDFPFGTVCMVK